MNSIKRLNIGKIHVDTTIKKSEVIKGIAELPEEFRGNLKNSMICPITYNELDDNAIYYDGDTYTLNGSQVYKNGEPVFSIGNTHIEIVAAENKINRDNDAGATKNGSTIHYDFNGTQGDITVVSCGYEYILVTGSFNSKHYITLFPVNPTHYKDIKSWEITMLGASETTRYFINPFHELVDINNGHCSVGNKTICNVIFTDFIMSGDTNHVFYTAENNNGYFYSNIEYIDGSYLTSDSIILATSQDGIYYGGFKVKNGSWSIDYYNNRPVQVSYKNKSMITQIDYAYIDKNEVYVIVKNKCYKLEIKAGAKLSIVDNMFIVANSPDVYNNTYDMTTGKAFCRNDAYNGSVLWVIDSNSLVDDPEARKTIYVATAINTQGQVEGNALQGTVWPSFPVYGLKDANYQLLDIYNDTDRVIVEVYKGTENSPTVPEFSFSLSRSGGYLDYSGFIYPDSTNTLWQVSEIDEYKDTYSGMQLINTPYGSFLSSVSNTQVMTFSYYIGTLIEINSVFILRGFIYGVTDNGYIVQMSIENGAISNTSIVTKSGIMEYIGNTQDYALFYNPIEKIIYKFDSGLKLTPYKEFSIEVPRLYACRPEDDKIAIATDSSIYVFTGDNIFRIESSVTDMAFNKGWLKAGNRAYSSYDGLNTLDVEYDSGKIGSSYDTSVSLEEVDVMLDTTDLKVPPYLEYKIEVGDNIGQVNEITPEGNNIIRLKPTTNNSEGLYFRIWLKTNANLMGVSIISDAFNKPNLTRNNG